MNATTPAAGGDLDARGLTSAQAAARARRDGRNVLPEAERRRWTRRLAEALREPMLMLLVAAAAIYAALGDALEAALLGVSVLFVISLTVYQQLRSDKALAALRDLSSPRAQVLRDGTWQRLPAADVVVDDLIELREGDRVPADGVLVEDDRLAFDESLLTGESLPVRRSRAGLAAGDDQVHAGALTVAGHGVARVTATGVRTGIGRIGQSLRGIVPGPTAMQRQMGRAVRVFAAIGLASCGAVVLLVRQARGDWVQAWLAGITLAISNVPEEFPVVLAVFLALGAWRMSKHRVLVRRAPAIEALGAITVLCTDKTGTLTRNHMEVAEVVLPAHAAASRAQVLHAAAQACVTRPHDPMEVAIVGAAWPEDRGARRVGTSLREYPLTDALLAYTRAWAGVPGEPAFVASKGAPEAIADLCRLDPSARQAVLSQAGELAARGLRVLGVASSRWPANGALPETPTGFDFAWLGLIGLADPLRAGVPDAVREAREAGIRVVMLTGDHPATAREIARQAGLPSQDGIPLGQALEAMDAQALQRFAATAGVVARARPEHKLRLVRALREAGDVVAMTGDGVNDAPALMAADVGIAMGQRGTDVAREAASIVLLDDDFVSVVAAVKQGRTIYDNIRRAVRFILAVHVPVTGMALLPLLTGAPLVVFPLHVVFLELIVDPACSIVLEQEPPQSDVMRRPPRPPARQLLDVAMLASGLGQGLAMFLAVGLVYWQAWRSGLPPGQTGAVAFIALVVGNLALIHFNRAGGGPGRRNAAFRIVVGAALGLLALVTQLPAAARLFAFEPPSAGWTAAALGVPLCMLVVLGWARRASARLH